MLVGPTDLFGPRLPSTASLMSRSRALLTLRQKTMMPADPATTGFVSRSGTLGWIGDGLLRLLSCQPLVSLHQLRRLDGAPSKMAIDMDRFFGR